MDTPATKPQPVIIMGTITTVLAVIFGGLGTIAGLQDNGTLATVCGVGMLVVGALNQGLAFYTRQQTVPLADTGAFLNDQREMVAGPASSVQTNAPAAVTAPAPDPAPTQGAAPRIETEGWKYGPKAPGSA